VSFYDEVLRELLAAVGAAMFFGNIYALFRRRADAQRAAAVSKARATARGPRASARGNARPVRSTSTARTNDDLSQAPLLRTMVYVVLGFVMMVAGIASLIAG
jgi:D-serine deaminase-like pyridoxal phosphate-dependent protein